MKYFGTLHLISPFLQFIQVARSQQVHLFAVNGTHIVDGCWDIYSMIHH